MFASLYVRSRPPRSPDSPVAGKSKDPGRRNSDTDHPRRQTFPIRGMSASQMEPNDTPEFGNTIPSTGLTFPAAVSQQTSMLVIFRGQLPRSLSDKYFGASRATLSRGGCGTTAPRKRRDIGVSPSQLALKRPVAPRALLLPTATTVTTTPNPNPNPNRKHRLPHRRYRTRNHLS